MNTKAQRDLIEGRSVLIVIDIQGGGSSGPGEPSIPFMPGYAAAMDKAPTLVTAARECGVPVVLREAPSARPRRLRSRLTAPRTSTFRG